MPILEPQETRAIFAPYLGKLATSQLWASSLVLALSLTALAMPKSFAKSKDKIEAGSGLTTELAASKEDVTQALQEVLDDLEIRGTYQYEKDKGLTGASRADTSSAFGEWKSPGQLFFKLAPNVVAPRHFKGTADIGTVSVRYIVESVAASKTRLRIDAVFIESGHREVHPSEGSVESGELGAIQEHLDAITAKRREAADETRRAAEEEVERDTERERRANQARAEQSSLQGLEQHVHDLRQQVQSIVKAAGAPLRGAPFKASPPLQTVTGGTEVVILIVTPYWYGIETPDGQRGWMPRSSLDAIP